MKIEIYITHLIFGDFFCTNGFEVINQYVWIFQKYFFLHLLFLLPKMPNEKMFCFSHIFMIEKTVTKPKKFFISKEQQHCHIFGCEWLIYDIIVMIEIIDWFHKMKDTLHAPVGKYLESISVGSAFVCSNLGRTHNYFASGNH